MNAETLTLGKETLGVYLQRKREERGFSIQEISEKTRIRTYYLESIEKGEYHRLPSLPYNRGFVRAYAEYIGVNADAAATHFIIEAGLEAEVGMIPETSTVSGAESASESDPKKNNDAQGVSKEVKNTHAKSLSRWAGSFFGKSRS